MKKSLKKSIDFLSVMSIFTPQIFFSFCNILGIKYDGSGSSNIYIYINILIMIFSLIIYAANKIKNKFLFNKSELILMFVSIAIFISYLIETSMYGFSNEVNLSFIYFIIWGISNLIIGYYMSQNKNYMALSKYLIYFALFLSVSAARTIFDSLYLGHKPQIGGATYQFAGYTYSLAFGLCLYYFRNKQTEIKYRVCLSISLFILLISILLTGARGAAVLTVIYLFFDKNIGNNKSASLLLNLLKLLILLVTIYQLILLLSKFPLLEEMIARSFEFINIEGINWEGSSGRNIIYKDALKVINGSPLFGYGLFSMFRLIGNYPHNVFLEILMQGGIIYLLLFLVCNFKLFVKYKVCVKQDSNILILSYLGLYIIVFLMFSGTYLSQGLFWFILSFFKNLNYKVTSR